MCEGGGGGDRCACEPLPPSVYLYKLTRNMALPGEQ